MIVCSDGMARGMDLEGVGLVVNYDVPSHAKTYVHRCGEAPLGKYILGSLALPEGRRHWNRTLRSRGIFSLIGSLLVECIRVLLAVDRRQLTAPPCT